MEHLEPGKRNPWLGTLVLDSLIWVLPKLYPTIQGEESMDPRDLAILIWTRTSRFLGKYICQDKSVKYILFHFVVTQFITFIFYFYLPPALKGAFLTTGPSGNSNIYILGSVWAFICTPTHGRNGSTCPYFFRAGEDSAWPIHGPIPVPFLFHLRTSLSTSVCFWLSH